MPEKATFVALDSIVNGWRQRALFYLDTTIWGKVWEVIDFSLNIALCVLYIVNTTVLNKEKSDPGVISTTNRLVEFIITLLFLGQYIIRYVVINGNVRVLEHLIVFVACAAPLIAYFTSISNGKVRASYMSAGVMAIFYPARFLRLHYSSKRLIATLAASSHYLKFTLIKQEAASLGADIATAILFFSSLVHSCMNWHSQENNIDVKQFSFLDSIYFISMSTIGKDDTIPRSVFSELTSMVIVALIAFTIPSRITRLVDLAIKTSTYSKTIVLPTASRHALLCGHIDIDSVQQFMREFFNVDHGPNIFKTTIVILHSDEPSLEMKAILRDPAYTNRVFYVKGKATNFKALKRARIDLATCVYILTRKHCQGTGIEEDAETVLTALALSAFSTNIVNRNVNNFTTERSPLIPKFSIYAEIILPESISHLTYLQVTRTICVDELRMGIMAQNSATPGFATLAFMLSTSVADGVDWDYSGVVGEAIAKSADEDWVTDYLHGIGQEIYQSRIPLPLVGRSFFKAARYYYRCHGLLVFGVGSFSPTRSPHSHMNHHPSIDADIGYYQVLLSPRNYTLCEYDMLFIISKDIQSVISASLFAERVTIKNGSDERISRSTYNKKTSSPKSSKSLSMNIQWKSLFNMHPSPAQLAPHPQLPKAPIHQRSPRIVVTRQPSMRKTVPQNYVSDSDSSYFSPARNIDNVIRKDNLPVFPSVKHTVGTRIEKVARRSDTVPNNIHNQIVICDSSSIFPRSVELLIQALKNAFEDENLPIVILSPASLDSERRKILDEFSNVYVVHGTPMSQVDLRRTHIHSAQKAIVLSSCADKVEKDSNEFSHDSAAILANMNIQSVCRGQFFITTELLDIESIRYLDHTQLLGEPLLKRTFMGGHIFIPTLIDTALCQSYFSSHILDILRHLTFSHSPSDNVYSMVETPKSEEADFIRSFKPGVLNLLYIPERFIGKRYDTMVLSLMKKHGSIPLGIYRTVSYEGQNFSCVICNPRPYTTIRPGDAVYSLGPNTLGWTNVGYTKKCASIATKAHEASGCDPESPDSYNTSGKNTKGSRSGSNQSKHTVYFYNVDDIPEKPTHKDSSLIDSGGVIDSDIDIDINIDIGADADAELSDIESGSPQLISK